MVVVGKSSPCDAAMVLQVNRTTPIVERAARILEEELASAPAVELLAMRTVGESSSASQVAESTRAVGILGDVLRRLLATPTPPAPARASAPELAPGADVSETTPMLVRLTARGRPGDMVDLTIGLVNDDPERTAEIGLGWTALLAAPTRTICEDRVTIEPASLRLGPGEMSDVVMRIDLPPDTAPGAYIGLVRTDQPGDHCAVVTIAVF